MEENKTYNLNQLAMITGYTTRSLRVFLKEGVLEGEKTDGIWRFSEEQVQDFISRQAVRQNMATKRNAVVFDFLAEAYRTENRACVILDFAVGEGEAMEISGFFCARMCEAKDMEFRFSYERGVARVILSGKEDAVSGMLKAYYEGK